MHSLPHLPAFPVFGLGAEFDGYRWLEVWNEWGRLWTVSLGHGHPESGSWISVTTVHKTPFQPVSGHDELVGVGPTGLHDAGSAAVLKLAQYAVGGDRTSHHAFVEAEDIFVPELETADLEQSWTRGTVIVGQVRERCWERRVQGAWAQLLDLPTVAVAVVAPSSAEPGRLVDVRETIDTYV